MIATDIKICGGGYEADISSVRGGTCFRLLHTPTGADLLRTPRNEEHLKENVYLFGNPLLFPPNRIVGGRFTFDGREYVLPLNEPATGCHVHGDLYEKAFTVTEQSESAVTLAFHAEAGEYIGFPHAFSFIRTYRVEENGLYEEDTVTNLSDSSMPFLLAYHTTFNLAFLKGSLPEDTRVRLNLGKEEMRTEKFIPTGVFRDPAEREEEFFKGTYTPHGKHLSAFYELAGDGTASITDTKKGLSIHYEAAENFSYRMLFATSDGGFFVCEPQTAAIDCFHLKGTPEEHGLIVLAPGESKTLWTRISVK